MFFGSQTAYRIRTALDLYDVGSSSLLGKQIFSAVKLSALVIPIYFAYSRFEPFEFNLNNLLKFIGWFILAHLVYEGLIIQIIILVLIRRKNDKMN